MPNFDSNPPNYSRYRSRSRSRSRSPVSSTVSSSSHDSRRGPVRTNGRRSRSRSRSRRRDRSRGRRSRSRSRGRRSRGRRSRSRSRGRRSRSRSRSRRSSSHISSSRHDIRRGPVHASGRSSSRSCSPVRTNGRSSRSLTVPPAPTVTPVPTVTPTPTVPPAPTITPVSTVPPAPTITPVPTVSPCALIYCLKTTNQTTLSVGNTVFFSSYLNEMMVEETRKAIGSDPANVMVGGVQYSTGVQDIQFGVTGTSHKYGSQIEQPERCALRELQEEMHMEGGLRYIGSNTDKNWKTWSYYSVEVGDMLFSPLQELKNQAEDKSQKTAVIVTGSYSEVRSLLGSYNNPGYTSDEIATIVFFRGDVALRIMGEVVAENRKHRLEPGKHLPYRITL